MDDVCSTGAVQNDEQLHDAIEEVPVVANDDQGAFEFQKGLLQSVAGPQIEVVGRFVQDQDVDALGHESSQGGSAAIAAA